MKDKQLSEYLKKLRKSRIGLTQGKLAELLGVTLGAVGQFERSESMPSTETLKKYAEIFKLTPGQIVDKIHSNTMHAESSAPEDLQKENERLTKKLLKMHDKYEALEEKYNKLLADYNSLQNHG